ncbi:MAG: prepilin-type N-terminal cleavage/methylation domain-containing protein [Planctomycetota bacterium]|jgi:prepilin-type N-terminal cleavage/methylation domain-containing protein
MIRRAGTLRRCGQRRAGVSMIEMLIAIGVLLVAVGGSYVSQLTSMGVIEQSRDRAQALMDLEACMEQVVLLPSASLPVAGSSFEHGVPVAMYEGLHLSEQRIVVTYPEFDPALEVPDPLQVVLTATWEDRLGRSYSQRLRGMRVR